MTELTDRERAVLDFERQWWKYPGAKDTAISEAFDWSPTRHHQVVQHLITRPEAMAYDAQLVGRLQRLRDRRKRQRSASRVA